LFDLLNILRLNYNTGVQSVNSVICIEKKTFDVQ